MQHVFQHSVAELEAAMHALDHTAAFLSKHMGNR
jgi:hypothetical protein